ncbi:MAG: flippase [Candidatus Omnitrophota bacterium]|nr:flippase [Candidatus Omnitrophota bacterium]
MKKLTQNFIWMGSANAISGVINVLLYVYLARLLGAERFGRFSFVQVIVLYMFSFIDLGLSTFGIREIAKHKSAVSDYVSNIVSLRFFIAAALYSLLAIFAVFSKQLWEVKIIMIIMPLWFFTFAFATEWAFQGLEKMYMVFISLVTTSALQFFFIWLLVKGPHYFFSVPSILFVATLPIIIIYLWLLKFRFKIKTLDLEILKVYFSSALIIWAISLFAQIYNGFDVIMMGWMRPASEVGYFTVARRFIGGITFFSIFLANAALPRYAATLRDGLDKFKVNTRQFLGVVGLIGAILLILVLFSKKLIVFAVGSEYLAASMSFNILMLGAVFVLLNLPFSTALIAAGLEKDVLWQVIASAVLNVGLNFYLIPKWGMEGASLSFVYAEALAVTWVVWLYRNKIELGIKSVTGPP